MTAEPISITDRAEGDSEPHTCTCNHAEEDPARARTHQFPRPIPIGTPELPPNQLRPLRDPNSQD